QAWFVLLCAAYAAPHKDLVLHCKKTNNGAADQPCSERERWMKSSSTQTNRDVLGRLLKAAGSIYDPEGVEALIEGVLAAPAEIGTGWHVLVAVPMLHLLASCLERLRAAL